MCRPKNWTPLQPLFSTHPAKQVYRWGFGFALSTAGMLALGSGAIAQVETQGPVNADPSAAQIVPEWNIVRPALRLGSQGNYVAELQAILKLLGYYDGAVDGLFQESTAIAVANFQQNAGLLPDRIVGPNTWDRLLPPVPEAVGRGDVESDRELSSASETVTDGAASSAAIAPEAEEESLLPPAVIFPTPAATQPVFDVSPPGRLVGAAPEEPIEANSTQPQASSEPLSSQTDAAAPAPVRAAAPNPEAVAAAETTDQPEANSDAVASVELPVLRLGMRGSAVVRLQERLRAIGLFNGAADGIFGPETQAAVRAVQRNYSLNPDGVVGPATWSALLR